MRSNYELYKILKAKYIKMRKSDPNAPLSMGICHVMDYLYGCKEIEPEEHSKLRIHFISQRPNSDLHPEFFLEENFRKNEAYWWDIYYKEKSDQSRIRFIEKMIMITKPTHIIIYERIKNLIKRIL